MDPGGDKVKKPFVSSTSADASYGASGITVPAVPGAAGSAPTTPTSYDAQSAAWMQYYQTYYGSQYPYAAGQYPVTGAYPYGSAAATAGTAWPAMAGIAQPAAATMPTSTMASGSVAGSLASAHYSAPPRTFTYDDYKRMQQQQQQQQQHQPQPQPKTEAVKPVAAAALPSSLSSAGSTRPPWQQPQPPQPQPPVPSAASNPVSVSSYSTASGAASATSWLPAAQPTAAAAGAAPRPTYASVLTSGAGAATSGPLGSAAASGRGFLLAKPTGAAARPPPMAFVRASEEDAAAAAAAPAAGPARPQYTAVGRSVYPAGNAAAAPPSQPSQPAGTAATSAPAQASAAAGAAGTAGAVAGAARPQARDLPKAAQEYLQRCYQLCRTPEDRAAMMDYLTNLIAEKLTTGQLYLMDWTAQRLPDMAEVLRAKYPPASSRADTSRRRRRSSSSSSRSSSISRRSSPPAVLSKRAQKRRAAAAATAGARKGVAMDTAAKSKRLERFGVVALTRRTAATAVRGFDGTGGWDDDAAGELDWDALTVRGTSTALEKKYLRLTSAPDPATVRPQPILEKSLEMVKQKWRNEECEYLYACEQLKSIRQDLTVQRIRNEFTVQVYETHARIALEKLDLPEFNQCQSVLRTLYADRIPGHVVEFFAYRLLYATYTGSQTDMLRALQEMSPELQQHPHVQHALEVHRAYALHNYTRFFRLYEEVPNMGGYLMDLLAKPMRMQALRAICKAYRPTVPFAFVQTQLGLEDEELAELTQTLRITAADDDPSALDTKKSAEGMAAYEAAQAAELARKRGARGVDMHHMD